MRGSALIPFFILYFCIGINLDRFQGNILRQRGGIAVGGKRNILVQI